MPDQVTMIDPDRGQPYKVDADKVDAAIAQGFKLEGQTERADRIVGEVKDEHYGGVGGKIAAGLAGAARGVTLGGSDVVLDVAGLGDDLQALKDVNPYTSIGGEIVGSLAATFTGVGPAGLVARTGAKIVGAGAGRGIAARTGAALAGGAFEGAAQGGGQYVSQVALDDKPLSAEGFLAATGSGALFGAGAGGALSIGESALVRAKALFPRSEVTREAAQEAERVATTEIRSVLDDGRSLAEAANEQLRQGRAVHAASDPEMAARISSAKARTEAARAETAEARAMLAEERAWDSKLKAAKAGSKEPRKTRKAFEDTAKEAAAPDVAAPAAAAGDDLLSKLQGTKQALDEGTPFTRIGKSIDDDADAIVASVNPQHGKLADATRELEEAQSAMDAWLGRYKGGQVQKFERSQAARETASSWRSKEAGYYSSTPAGEGSAALPRGRQSTFRGTAEQKAAADAPSLARLGNQKSEIDDVVEQMARRRSGAVDDVDAIVSGARNVDDDIATALRVPIGEHAQIGDDVAEAIQVISRVEHAQANVADLLGPAAPMSVQQRAAGLRGAVAQQQEAGAMHAAQAADDIAKKLPADMAVPGKLQPVEASNVGAATGGGTRKAAGMAADAGAVLEVLSSLGVEGMPSVRDLPVLGPVLSLYLKARAAGAIFRRLGGKVPESIETRVASKAAQTRDRVQKAVDKLLDYGAAGARKAQRTVGTSAGLGYKLFDAKVTNDDRPARKKSDTRREYEARIAELGAAMQPNAIADAVRKSVPTGDPALQQAVIETQERKLKFLDAKAPKRLALPTLLKGDGDWMPNRVQLESFARYIEAAENPVGVLEGLATHGTVTYEAAETLRTVYPALYKQAQLRLLERAPDLQETLPYSRRVALSILFQVPVDGTMDATFVSYLQQAAKPAANAQQPAQGSPAAAPPTPTASGPVMLGDRTMTRLDRRAGA